MVSTSPPTFRRPPVAEVVLTAQFEPLSHVRVVDLGEVWHQFEDNYPLVEEHPRLPPLSLELVVPPFQVRMADVAEIPRLWFVNEEQTRLVQFQQDRLSVNWRRLRDEPYPRYEGMIRPMFIDAWQRLERATTALGIPAPVPTLCEALYLNPIESGEVWQRHSELGSVVTLWAGSTSDSFLPEPDEVGFDAKYSLPEGNGWLAIKVTPVRRMDDNRPVFMLQLTGRCHPRGPGLEGALQALDLAHDWIVRSFKSVTTSAMHQAWEEVEDA